MSFIEQIMKDLIELGNKSEEIEGCTDEEIEEIRRVQGVERLPELYVEYLRLMGRYPGDLFRGSEVNYRCLTSVVEGEGNFKERAVALLKEWAVENFELPEDAFIFIWHQSYIFLYFDTKASDYDPKTHYYSEGKDAPREHMLFSEVLTKEVELKRRNREMKGY
jgi:hypothetical protein